jgi:hypothetical protein
MENRRTSASENGRTTVDTDESRSGPNGYDLALDEEIIQYIGKTLDAKYRGISSVHIFNAILNFYTLVVEGASKDLDSKQFAYERAVAVYSELAYKTMMAKQGTAYIG